MGEIRSVGTGETRGYPYPVCKKKPSDTDSIKSNISSKTSRGKKDSTKRHHHRHHQRQPGEQHFPIELVRASLTFNNYFYLFLYLYITRITINNNIPHLKSPRPGGGEWRGRGGLQLVCG